MHILSSRFHVFESTILTSQKYLIIWYHRNETVAWFHCGCQLLLTMPSAYKECALLVRMAFLRLCECVTLYANLFRTCIWFCNCLHFVTFHSTKFGHVESYFPLQFWKLFYFGKCFFRFIEIKMWSARNSLLCVCTFENYFLATSTDLQTNYWKFLSSQTHTRLILSFKMGPTTAVHCTSQFYSV